MISNQTTRISCVNTEDTRHLKFLTPLTWRCYFLLSFSEHIR